MPLTLKAVHDLDDPQLREEVSELYDRSPEFADGNEAVKALDLALARGDTLYLGEFNDRPIAAIWSLGRGPERTLQYIVVHPANRGRGIAEQLCELVTKQEEKQGVIKFKPGCGAIRRALQNINKL